MLNRIIRLQAIIEIITNQTASALKLLAKQQTQMQTTINQNRLAFYLKGGYVASYQTVAFTQMTTVKQ
jgi:hypothetical protein